MLKPKAQAVKRKMKPKTKAEPKVQIKLSLAKSVADACAAARQEATDTPYDWNGTMAEAVDRENLEFRRHVAEYKAKISAHRRANSQPTNQDPQWSGARIAMKCSGRFQSRNGVVAKTRFSESYCSHPPQDDTFQNPQRKRVKANLSNNNSTLS